jgi:hypothetical protein
MEKIMRINTEVVFEWDDSSKSYNEVYCDSYEYSGVVDECKGGGTSGAVEHPSYIANTFNILVSGEAGDPSADDFKTVDTTGNVGINLLQALAIATYNENPYEDVNAFPPDTYNSISQEQWETTDTAIRDTALTTETTRWGIMHEAAKVKADNIFTGQEIDDEVDDFSAKGIDEFNTSVNRFSTGMAEANAIHSSSFIIGMALLERKRLDSINTHRTKLVITNQVKKTEYMMKAIADMASLMNMHMGNRLEILRWQTEINRIAIINKKEQIEMDVEFARADAIWDLELIGKAANVMAAPGGGQYLPEKPSAGASALSGALSGAATGATIGSAVPGVGTAIGAGVGAILGAFS